MLLETKQPVHTIAELGNCYAVTREKEPKFSAIFENNQLTNVVWENAPPNNADTILRKALAFINSYLTTKNKNSHDNR